jgi:hypothetical protein
MQQLLWSAMNPILICTAAGGGVSMHTKAMLVVVLVFAVVLVAIDPSMHTMAMHVVVLPFADALVAIGPNKDTVAIVLVVLVIAGAFVAIGENMHAASTHGVIFPLTVVPVAIGQSKHAAVGHASCCLSTRDFDAPDCRIVYHWCNGCQWGYVQDATVKDVLYFC